MTNDGAGDGDTRVRHVTTFFLGLAAAIAAGFLLHASEAEAWRTSGSILEVLGLVLAVLAVDGKVAKVTGRPRIFRRLLEGGRRAWRRVLSLFGRGREGRSVTLEAGSGDVVTTGAEARMSVRPAEDADVERWIRYLKEELEALRSRVQAIQRKMEERMDRLSDELGETRRQLRASDREIEDLVERLTVGGFEWELVGLGWFLAGVLASAWGQYLPLP